MQASLPKHSLTGYLDRIHVENEQTAQIQIQSHLCKHLFVECHSSLCEIAEVNLQHWTLLLCCIIALFVESNTACCISDMKKKNIHVHDMIRFNRMQVKVGQFDDKPTGISYIL